MVRWFDKRVVRAKFVYERGVMVDEYTRNYVHGLLNEAILADDLCIEITIDPDEVREEVTKQWVPTGVHRNSIRLTWKSRVSLKGLKLKE